MTVDLDLYKVSKEAAQRWYLTKGHNQGRMAVSMMSLMTSVPCIVSAFWIGELTGYPPEIIECIEQLIAFYKYTEIKNKPANCPI